jgi:hypothetical protein
MIAKDYSYQIVTVNGLYNLYKEEIDAELTKQFRFEDTEGMGDYDKLNTILAFFSLYYLNLESLVKNNDLTIDYDALVECCSTLQFKDWVFKQECVGAFSSGFSNGFQAMLDNAFSSGFSGGFSKGQLACSNVETSKNPFVTMERKITNYCY